MKDMCFRDESKLVFADGATGRWGLEVLGGKHKGHSYSKGIFTLSESERKNKHFPTHLNLNSA